MSSANPYQLSHAVALSLGSARDHLHALRALVIDANALHTSAPWTLCRAALENGAQAPLAPEPARSRGARDPAAPDGRPQRPVRCAATMLLAPTPRSVRPAGRSVVRHPVHVGRPALVRLPAVGGGGKSNTKEIAKEMP